MLLIIWGMLMVVVVVLLLDILSDSFDVFGVAGLVEMIGVVFVFAF